MKSKGLQFAIGIIVAVFGMVIALLIEEFAVSVAVALGFFVVSWLIMPFGNGLD